MTVVGATSRRVGERVRALGGRAAGTLEEFRKSARLGEEPGVVPAAREMLAALLADHEALTRTLRTDVDTGLPKPWWTKFATQRQ